MRKVVLADHDLNIDAEVFAAAKHLDHPAARRDAADRIGEAEKLHVHDLAVKLTRAALLRTARLAAVASAVRFTAVLAFGTIRSGRDACRFPAKLAVAPPLFRPLVAARNQDFERNVTVEGNH